MKISDLNSSITQFEKMGIDELDSHIAELAQCVKEAKALADVRPQPYFLHAQRMGRVDDINTLIVHGKGALNAMLSAD